VYRVVPLPPKWGLLSLLSVIFVVFRIVVSWSFASQNSLRLLLRPQIYIIFHANGAWGGEEDCKMVQINGRNGPYRWLRPVNGEFAAFCHGLKKDEKVLLPLSRPLPN
jgi:hypothetical protein